jgi:hypothetical protein
MASNRHGRAAHPDIPSDAPFLTVEERRSEERFDCEGEVSLSLEEPVHQEFTGTLMDYSKSGFRAMHCCAELRAGQVVHFRHTVSSGTARVMWNRVLAEQVETGFLVVSSGKPKGKKSDAL